MQPTKIFVRAVYIVTIVTGSATDVHGEVTRECLSRRFAEAAAGLESPALDGACGAGHRLRCLRGSLGLELRQQTCWTKRCVSAFTRKCRLVALDGIEAA